METAMNDDPEKPHESKRRERFRRVAGRRTRVILQEIRRLSNCSNLSAYEYNEGDVRKIFSAIESEVATAKARFQRREGKEVEFSID